VTQKPQLSKGSRQQMLPPTLLLLLLPWVGVIRSAVW
jgi:hypothetical protein